MHTQTLEAPPAQKKKSTTRLPFLDWTRGMAATIMLQGHVFHSFARPETRESGPYVISQFIGGIAPAIFLFLTGVTLAFMMHGMERKAASGKDRVITAFRRAGYLGLLAFAFRFQLFLFGYPYSAATDLLKVDILNCMALAIITLAGLALLKTPQRVHAGVIAGIIIASSISIDLTASPGIHARKLSACTWCRTRTYFSYLPMGCIPRVRCGRRLRSYGS